VKAVASVPDQRQHAPVNALYTESSRICPSSIFPPILKLRLSRLNQIAGTPASLVSNATCPAHSLNRRPWARATLATLRGVKRLAVLVFVLVLVVVALASAGKNRTSTTINSSPPPPTTTRVPSRDTHAGISLTHCDQNITVGPHTSCGFAEDVFKAYAAALHAGPRTPANYSFQASSPATGKSYALSCRASEGSNSTATCSTDTGATVSFPVQAARVYNTSGSARRTKGGEAPPPAEASGE
jgi:hypothetical protein